jgi:hypothetical protein
MSRPIPPGTTRPRMRCNWALFPANDCDVELEVRCDKLERSYTDREIAFEPVAVCGLALRLSGTGRE